MRRIRHTILAASILFVVQVSLAASLSEDVASIQKAKNWPDKVKILVNIDAQFNSEEKIWDKKLAEARKNNDPAVKNIEQQYVDSRVSYYEFKPIIDTFSDFKKAPTSAQCEDVAVQVRAYDLMGATDDQTLSAEALLALSALDAFCAKN